MSTQYARLKLQEWGFVLRAATGGKERKSDEEVHSLRKMVSEDVARLMEKHSMVPDLVFNIDETGLLLLPSQKKTYVKKESAGVFAAMPSSKKQVSLLFAASLAGRVSPFQILFAGMTTRTVPKSVWNPLQQAGCIATVPGKNAKTGKVTHFADGKTFELFVERVLIPFREKICSEMKMPPDSRAVVIMDGHYSHNEALLKDSGFVTYLLPPRSTEYCQPLDAFINAHIKMKQKTRYADYHIARLQAHKKATGSFNNLPPLSSGKVKALSVAWLLETWKDSFSGSSLLVRRSWDVCMPGCVSERDRDAVFKAPVKNIGNKS